MKNFFVLLTIVFCGLGKLSAQTPYCDTTLWTHVYHSYRLVIHNDCMTVTGHIYGTPYSEADGDYHIRLAVDAQFTGLLNASNTSSEDGCLVCEPVCVVTPTQTDAITPCAGYTNGVYLPNAGEYVAVTGPYVTDNDHGWNELHPVTSIVIYHPAGLNPGAGPLPELKVYPVPASNAVHFSFAAAPHTTTYITMYTEDGREVGDYMLAETSEFVLNTTFWPNATYIYKISQGKETLKSGKFVVAK